MLKVLVAYGTLLTDSLDFAVQPAQQAELQT